MGSRLPPSPGWLRNAACGCFTEWLPVAPVAGVLRWQGGVAYLAMLALVARDRTTSLINSIWKNLRR